MAMTQEQKDELQHLHAQVSMAHGTTKLRLLGAMHWLLYCYSAQDDA
jgi:hypothetical protein